MPSPQPPKPGKYIDPLVDFAFKKIFGSEPNKDLLIAFLNEVFRGRKVIADLAYSPAEQSGDSTAQGNVVFDLICTDSDGSVFIIEMQRACQQFFKERALYYTSRLISNQGPKGESKRWKYDLQEVYLIALLEKFVLEGSPDHEYIHDISLCYTHTGQVFYPKSGYTTIELAKFIKTESGLVTDLDKWLYVLKSMSRMDKLPVYLRKPIFEKLFQVAEYANLTTEERIMYDNIVKAQWDTENAIESAEMKGEIKKAFQIAAEMKKEGMPVEQIVRFTKLSIEQIENL